MVIAVEEQDNNIDVDQVNDQENNCDESGTGLNDATCENPNEPNNVGLLTQNNEVTGGIADAAESKTR